MVSYDIIVTLPKLACHSRPVDRNNKTGACRAWWIRRHIRLQLPGKTIREPLIQFVQRHHQINEHCRTRRAQTIYMTARKKLESIILLYYICCSERVPRRYLLQTADAAN